MISTKQSIYQYFLQRHRYFESRLEDKKAQFDLDGLSITTIKIVLLQVELAEFLNEWRRFKYWSEHPYPNWKKSLEEFADILHAAVGLGEEFGVTMLNEPEASVYQQVMTQWIYINLLVNQLHTEGTHNFSQLMHEIWHLGRLLGFEEDSLVFAFDKKDAKNHRRQDTGY